MSRRGLTKFDTSFLSNDGGKYSPSIRRLRQHYLHDTKIFPNKTCSSSIHPTTMTIPNDDSRLSSSHHHHHQSSNDLMETPLKCDDCQKHDGLFQCCHCNQRLCIRCCNKHYKKVTAELEYLNELSDCLLTKILHTKNDLEKQKNETIEQCHKWRIDTINTINKAHTLIIQTINDEYEILGKEYELFVDKEMARINIDKNELIRMKKGNLGSLLSSLSSSSSSTTIDPTKSIDMIKQRIETFAKYIDDTGKCSFQVKLPTFLIDETLRVESCFNDITRSTSATWHNDDYIADTLPTKSNEISKQKFSSNSQSINSSFRNCETLNLPYTPSIDKSVEIQLDYYDSNDEIASLSADSPFHNHYEDYFSSSIDQFNLLSQKSPRTSSTSSSSSSAPSVDKTNYDNDDTYQSIQHVQLQREQDGSLKGLSIQLEKSQQNDGIIEQRRTCMEAYGIRRKPNALPYRSPSNTERFSHDYPWLYYRANSSPSFI
ncbi:unnamed protein product [Adineta steineri]|uniref:B box-type domain-containing protein n=1 Tax=Adineta steineri TaxID=433720 RepID=A0A815PLM9_9BILA|nr:unnamed protein product [Adineta steineri]CAF1450895.1 unnamed protein product [Adineta steineri]